MALLIPSLFSASSDWHPIWAVNMLAKVVHAMLVAKQSYLVWTLWHGGVLSWWSAKEKITNGIVENVVTDQF